MLWRVRRLAGRVGITTTTTTIYYYYYYHYYSTVQYDTHGRQVVCPNVQAKTERACKTEGFEACQAHPACISRTVTCKCPTHGIIDNSA